MQTSILLYQPGQAVAQQPGHHGHHGLPALRLQEPHRSHSSEHSPGEPVFTALLDEEMVKDGLEERGDGEHHHGQDQPGGPGEREAVHIEEGAEQQGWEHRDEGGGEQPPDRGGEVGEEVVLENPWMQLKWSKNSFIVLNLSSQRSQSSQFV